MRVPVNISVCWCGFAIVLVFSGSPTGVPNAMTGPMGSRTSSGDGVHTGSSPIVDSHPMLLESEASVELLDRARDSIMRLKFEQADSLLGVLKLRPDGSPAVAYHRTAMALLRVFFFDSRETYDDFFDRSDHLGEVLDNRKASIGRDYLRAENVLLRTLVWIKKRDYVKAVLAGNAAFKAFERLTKTESVLPEAWKGMGLLHMMIGAVPRTYRRYLTFFGYSGTLEEGVSELHRAVEESTYAREEALIYLATLDLYEFPAGVDAVDVLSGLWRRYAGSPLFGLLYGDALIRRRQAPAAETVLRRAREVSLENGVVSVAYLDFFLGFSVFLQNRFSEARGWFTSFLDRSQASALRMRTRLRIGETLELEGDRDAAVGWYNRVAVEREYEEDAAAGKHARDLLAHPMDAVDRRLLIAHNDFRSGKLDDAVVVFEEVYAIQGVRPVQQAESAYRLGRLNDHRSDFETAALWYERAIDTPGDPLARYAPWSMYYLAKIEAERGHNGRATRLLRRLLDYDGKYEFRPSMERRATLLLDRIGGD